MFIKWFCFLERKKADNQDWTGDRAICNRVLYHWAMPALLVLYLRFLTYRITNKYSRFFESFKFIKQFIEFLQIVLFSLF